MRGAAALGVLSSIYVSISIHAPHAGSGVKYLKVICLINDFNPRSPCGERPWEVNLSTGKDKFQSTLPMRGAAPRCSKMQQTRQDFNPRSPCGERPDVRLILQLRFIFQSTLPMRGAARSDKQRGNLRHNFNPRSPCGERHIRTDQGEYPWHFNPRSPCGERRLELEIDDGQYRISIHAPHAGSGGLMM